MDYTVDYDHAVQRIAEHVRGQLAEDAHNSLHLEINIKGRVHDGELEISYKFHNFENSYSHTEGGTLQATLSEHLRRNAWNKRHAPLCLPKVQI